MDELLGFTRHERLDVKKPGPPADIPLDDHPTINANATEKHSNEIGLIPNVKKYLHLDFDDDHAPHSVDNQFVYVIFKTP